MHANCLACLWVAVVLSQSLDDLDVATHTPPPAASVAVLCQLMRYTHHQRVPPLHPRRRPHVVVRLLLAHLPVAVQ